MDYLKVACRDFNGFMRHVLLQLDEIHVRSDYYYKGGKVFGSSFIKTDSADTDSLSTPDPAKSVLAFQVTSLGYSYVGRENVRLVYINKENY